MKIVEILGKDYDRILDRLIQRGDQDFFEVDKIVNDIIAEVKEKKDEALFSFTRKFDEVSLVDLKVSEKEMDDAFKSVDAELIDIMKEAATNIREYHQLQEFWRLPKSSDRYSRFCPVVLRW